MTEIPRMASTRDLATLAMSEIVPHRDAIFDMHTPAGTVPLKLVKVDPAGNSGREGGAFSPCCSSRLRAPFCRQEI